jgi:GWxTD domain-containing protein
MKRLFALLALIYISFAAVGQNLQSALNYCVFNNPGKGPYVETYLMVRGETAAFIKNANGKFQGNVEVMLTVSRGDSVFYADKYNLLSPEVDDTSGTIPNFIDLHTIPLRNGNYSLELSITDVNRFAPAFKGSLPLTISYSADNVAISDIMTVESYAKGTPGSALFKGGFDMVPYVSSYYPETVTELNFYAEVYNTDKLLGAGEKFVLTSYIEDADKKQPIDRYFKTKVYPTQPVTASFVNFEIADLPSGNYNLVVEVKDKNNALVAIKKLFIQRSGVAAAANQPSIESNLSASFTSFELYTFSLKTDTLKEYIRSLRPIALLKEQYFIDKQLKKVDSLTLRKFFVGFWEAHAPDNQFKGWGEYLTQIRIVNKYFGTAIRRGYMTDRGRVFLQYGAPNNRTISPREPSAYPYEIWHYYRIGTQNNRRFVFYNPDLITNDFILLHSDALGEPMDDQWQFKLHRRDTQTNDIDINGVDPSYGGRSNDLFNTPR